MHNCFKNQFRVLLSIQKALLAVVHLSNCLTVSHVKVRQQGPGMCGVPPPHLWDSTTRSLESWRNNCDSGDLGELARPKLRSVDRCPRLAALTRTEDERGGTGGRLGGRVLVEMLAEVHHN